MKYTEREIERLRERAFALGLVANTSFFQRPASELIDICNGVGGEGCWYNDILTLVFNNYQASAAIHDEGYHVGGEAEDRKRIDDEFRDNMIKEWVAKYGRWRWFRPVALLDRRKINPAYKAVRLAGHNYFHYK